MSSSSIIQRIRSLLEATAPFNRLSEDERQGILADLSIEYFQTGEVVLEQGSTSHRGLFLVESGLMRLMDVDQQRLVDMCQEGDLFGSFGLIKGGAIIYEAKAIEETVCALIRVGRFRQLYDENKEFAAFFDRDIRRYFHHMNDVRDVSGAHLLDRRLATLSYRPLVTCTPEATAQEAARLMRREAVGSVVVMRGDRIAGIMTDVDLRSKLVARGLPPDTPVRRLMTSRVSTVPERSTLFEALATMLQEHVQRLVVTRPEEGGTPVGMLTDRDVGHVRGLDPVATLNHIAGAPSVARLADIRADVDNLLLRLYRQGVPAEQLGRLMAIFHDRVVTRILMLVERKLKAEGEEAPRLSWVWMRLGSGGRQEAALSSRQHNALVYADPSTDEETARAEHWFAQLTDATTRALEACGFAASEVVAREARWQKPLREWKRTYRTWIHEAGEEALALVPFFFDLRGVHGDLALVEALREDIGDALNVEAMDEERGLLRLMASNALERRPPISLFGRFFVRGGSGETAGRFDIREHGMLPVVDAARILALELRYLASSNTFDRLRQSAEALPELRGPLDAVLDAYQHFVEFRLEHQLRAVELGEAPNNLLDPSMLSRVQQNLLRNGFSAVGDLQDALAERYDVSRRRGLRARG